MNADYNTYCLINTYAQVYVPIENEIKDAMSTLINNIEFKYESAPHVTAIDV